ncbi:hypothetical protein K501DRAFT_275147 [Backusella circina FSU 941]|nr:hypothetical protein K501DRAFT_275147 [Backusella circina FSU 941]
MTIVKFNTHLTSDLVYTNSGVSFNVIFGERPVTCFTNQVDVIASLTRVNLSLGDSIELTEATLLTTEKGPNHIETTFKVIQIELLGTYYVYRKRKREEAEERAKDDQQQNEPLSPLVSKKRKEPNVSPIVDKMSLCPDERDSPGFKDSSSNGSIRIAHYDVKEYKGNFMEFFQKLRESIERIKAQPLDPTIEDELKNVEIYMDNLWGLFLAMQSLSDDDEIAVIIRLVEAVKNIITTMNNFTPKFEENESEQTLHTILLPSYIFTRFMKAKNRVTLLAMGQTGQVRNLEISVNFIRAVRFSIKKFLENHSC